MDDSKIRNSRAIYPDPPVEGWPGWLRGVISLALAFQIAAVVTGAAAAPPSSSLQRAVVQWFAPYHQLTDQGYSYRYYAPEPGPTPVVTAKLTFGDGRPEETVRLPARGVLPRLRYQRQLALANHLAGDFTEARRHTGDGRDSPWARSYARHLAKTRPGCVAVTLSLQAHLIPDPAQVGEAVARGRAVDLDAEEFYTTPERIGEFPCDGS